MGDTGTSTNHGLMLFAGLALAFAALAAPPSPRASSALATPSALQGEGEQNDDDPLDNAQKLRSLPGYGTADSNGSMIAVTGIDLTGSSILYLIDTDQKQLAVYQANGGADSTQSIKLVGARRIDLDLQLYGFNDKSEFTFEDLERKFAENRRQLPRTK